MVAELAEDKKIVPKFTSFRAKPALIVQSAAPDGRQHSPKINGSPSRLETVPLARSDRSSATHSRRHHRHDKEETRRKHYQYDKHDKEGLNIPVTQWDDELDVFVIDKYGDSANLDYGSLHRYKVPVYSRSGSGMVLGLPGNQRINREASSDKHVITSDIRNTYSVKRDKAAFSHIHRTREKRIKPIAPIVAAPIENNANFLPFEVKRRSKQQKLNNTEFDGSFTTDDEESHYRSIEGKAKPSNVPDDPDLEYNDIVQSSDEENVTKSTKITLSQKVEAEPSSGRAWLDLIDFQGYVLESKSKNGRASAAERTSTADIKLSMYEKALTTVKDLHYRERLIQGMMNEGVKIWEPRKLSGKWQSVLQENPGYAGLWIQYLDFQETNFSVFHFEKLREIFLGCLTVLRGTVSRRLGDTSKIANLIEIQIYVLIRTTLCMREAGFPEQAAAIWQALLEINCCRSPAAHGENSDGRFGQYLEGFEEFWESEVPRIGEAGARGWVNYSSDDSVLPEPQTDATIPTFGEKDLVDRWHVYEDASLLLARRPARTIDITGDDDPYRVILYSDVKDFIIEIPSSSRQSLVYGFLVFCNLPPPANTPNDLLLWWRDQFLRNNRLDGPHIDRLLHSQPHLAGNRETTIKSEVPTLSTSSCFDFPMPLYPSSTDTLFAKKGAWYSVFDQSSQEYGQNDGPADVEWVRRVLGTLVDANIGGDDLAEYLLAFECKITPEAVRRTARTLLKRQSVNMRLYNAYALIEFRLGDRAKAESVLTTAINMIKTFDHKDQKDTIILWRTWIWELLYSLQDSEALKRLVTLTDPEVKQNLEGVTVSPATILKSQKALTDGRDHALYQSDYPRAILYSECLILLDYLKDSSNINTALASFDTQITPYTDPLPPNSPAHELLHQSRAKLLHHHTTHTTSFKPALVRSTLTHSIQLFPQNTIFLSLYAWHETRFRIDDRVRSIVQDILLSSKPPSTTPDRSPRTESIISHFFAVHAELVRSRSRSRSTTTITSSGSNTHSIRGAFERALDSPACKHSVAMWTLYFRVELLLSGPDLRRATALFYRAVRACPWAKELYLLPFRYLRPVMPREELRGVYEMVVEKELRVFVNLDDAFEGEGGG